ncbi:type IV pilus biogenesis protein PilP [Pantoea agglomerans]|uniref:type IV pilus biogenesis protein PilP n=1 Tax=Enterobacter agglomerans TaxID=549 RepID=UPI003D20723E
MQKNKWRYLLLPVLATGHLAIASPEAAERPGEHRTAVLSIDMPAVAAQAGTAATPDTSLGRLEDIQAKTLLYEAQLAQAKALNELQKNGYDAVLGAPFNPQPAAPVNDKGEVKPAQESRALPLIVEISGGQQLSAMLQLDGGNQVRVQAGSRIPGTAWTVAKITFSEVTVSSPDKGLTSLAFAG